MESWLSDVQRVRIPRPKFGSGNSVRRSNSTVQHVRPEVLSRQTQDVAKATEELRQALQDKLWLADHRLGATVNWSSKQTRVRGSSFKDFTRASSVQYLSLSFFLSLFLSRLRQRGRIVYIRVIPWQVSGFSDLWIRSWLLFTEKKEKRKKEKDNGARG